MYVINQFIPGSMTGIQLKKSRDKKKNSIPHYNPMRDTCCHGNLSFDLSWQENKAAFQTAT